VRGTSDGNILLYGYNSGDSAEQSTVRVDMDKGKHKSSIYVARQMGSNSGGVMASWRIISETEPDSNYKVSGQMWIKPSIGQAYIYIDGAWQPLAGGVAIDFHVPLTLIVQGQDRTVESAGSLRKTDVLTSQVDSLTFTYEDLDGSYKPKEGDEVLLFYKADESSTPVKMFAGRIESAPQEQIAPGITKYRYAVRCVDYSADLNKRLVVESYSDKTCKEIIDDLVDTYATDFTTHNVQTGFTVDYISWNYKPLSACLKELVALSGGLYDWYVDENKDIHFFYKETSIAPYELNETSESGASYSRLSISVDKSQLRNRVYVRGGYYLSDDFTQEIVADGEQEEFLLAYKPKAAASGSVEVYVNGTQKTVGTDHLDTSGYDFVVNYTEKLVKNLDHATLASGDILKAVYKYDIPILVRVDNEDSQETMKAIEGGDGVYEHIIVDSSIETLDAARDRALAELDKYADPIISGDFITNNYGYRSGQLLTVNLPSRGINDTYLITRVQSYLRRNILEYRIKFESKRSKNFVDLLVDLLDAKNEIITREDEILNELAQVADSVGLTETSLNYEEPTNEWDTAKWDEFQWG